MPNHLSRAGALLALLSALLSTGCTGHPVLSPRQQLPADLLTCAAQPIPGALDTDVEAANYILDLADAGAECREHLAAVKQAIGQ